jgi:hypothetical protein
MQSLGSGHAVATDCGCLYRIDAKDTDALALSQLNRAKLCETYWSVNACRRRLSLCAPEIR